MTIPNAQFSKPIPRGLPVDPFNAEIVRERLISTVNNCIDMDYNKCWEQNKLKIGIPRMSREDFKLPEDCSLLDLYRLDIMFKQLKTPLTPTLAPLTVDFFRMEDFYQHRMSRNYMKYMQQINSGEWRVYKKINGCFPAEILAIIGHARLNVDEQQEFKDGLLQYANWLDMISEGAGEWLYYNVKNMHLPAATHYARTEKYYFRSETEMFNIMEFVYTVFGLNRTLFVPRLVYVGLIWEGLTDDEALHLKVTDVDVQNRIATVVRDKCPKIIRLSERLVSYIKEATSYNVILKTPSNPDGTRITHSLSEGMLQYVVRRIQNQTDMNASEYVEQYNINLKHSWDDMVAQLPLANPLAIKSINTSYIHENQLLIDIYESEQGRGYPTFDNEKSARGQAILSGKYDGWKQLFTV